MEPGPVQKRLTVPGPIAYLSEPVAGEIELAGNELSARALVKTEQGGIFRRGDRRRFRLRFRPIEVESRRPASEQEHEESNRRPEPAAAASFFTAQQCLRLLQGRD